MLVSEQAPEERSAAFVLPTLITRRAVRPLVIAWDLDDVAYRSAERLVEISNSVWNSNITINDVSEDWPQMWGVDISEAERRAEYLNSPEVIRSYVPFQEELSPILETARSQGAINIILTSRPTEVARVSIECVQRDFKGYFSKYVSSGIYDGPEDPARYALSKTAKYISEGVDLAIDDQAKHIEGALSAGRKGILLGDYPWNRSRRQGVQKAGGKVALDHAELSTLLNAEGYYIAA